MGGPKPIFAWGKSCRTAVARTWAEECRSTSSACGSLSVRIETLAPSGSGRARSRTSPFTRAATAALASPGPIAFARSAPEEPAGRRFSLPSGSVTRISDGISSVVRLASLRRRRRGRWSVRQGLKVQSLAEIQRDRKRDRHADGDPARDAAGRKNWRFVGHERRILAQTERWWRMVEDGGRWWRCIRLGVPSTNLHHPPPTSITCLL